MMANDWAGVVNTTAIHYLKGASDLTLRDRLVFRRMNEGGRITYNWDGPEVQWQVKFSLPETQAYGGETLDFAPSDKYRKLNLDWRGYISQDKLTEKERLMNRGVPQLINRYDAIMKDMRQSMEDAFSGEIYVNGYATTDRMHGLESFLVDDGQTASGDKIAVPSTTYAGRLTTPGGEAGIWSSLMTTPPSTHLGSDWPNGQGDPMYDFLSPKLINITSTQWKTADTTWADICHRVIRQGILWATMTTGRAGRPDLIVLSQDLFYDYANFLEPQQRIIIPFKENQEVGTMPGYAYQQEGVEVTSEFPIAPKTGYILNTKKMEMRCMYPQLFYPRGPEFDLRSMSHLFLMAYFGNMAFEPKYFGKLFAYA
jgi:hypothetical protein